MYWCGYLNSGLRFWAVAAIVSLALGAIMGILTIRKRDIKIPVVVTIGVFFTINFSCCGYWMWCGNNFECSGGFGDYFRLPVKYPYQISSIDVLDEGCLDRWDEDNSDVVCGITDYTLHFSIMVGKIEDPFTSMGCTSSEEWFSFNLDTGELTCYSSRRAFIDACKTLGFAGMPRLKSVREHYGEHYEDSSYPLTEFFIPDFW